MRMVMPALRGQLPDDVQDLLGHFRVRGGGWLVKEHDLRLHSHGPDDGQPLLYSAESCRILISLVSQTHPAQQGHGSLLFRPDPWGPSFPEPGPVSHFPSTSGWGTHVEMLETPCRCSGGIGRCSVFVGDVLSRKGPGRRPVFPASSGGGETWTCRRRRSR